ncbi:MAG: tRNA pseudouridine55 synthase, partial [Hyphomicrobiaceae bacterium]
DEKAYRFTVRWGIATTTDDTEGDATNTSDSRPSITDIEAVLPQFVGAIEQVPPKFSAIKVNGNRAYDLARGGQDVELKSRIVQISDLSIEETPDADHTTFAAICGKGTYVRSLARDIGGILGCFGHISDLRRTRVGPFNTENCTTFEELEAALEQDKAGDEPATVARDDMLLPVEAALNGLEHLSISSLDASRLIRGQSVLMRGRDAPIFVGTAYATSRGKLIALVDCDRGTLRPTRVFNLGG